MKKISILGSTGSIGTQTLEVVRRNPDALKVVALSCGKNTELLEKQIREFHPSLACVADEGAASDLRVRTADTDVRIVWGMEGLEEAAAFPDADITVTAVVGMIGILPTLAAIRAGKDIALANKETLVTAGHIIMPLARDMHVNIYPVDSEHSAIFQCLHGEKHEQIEKILLTASGGPFRGFTAEQLKGVKVEDALKHPNWNMGRKITIDSASMVNKGLEVMEVRWLFDVPLENIEVVIQPQSVIHSMVQFADGAVIAQLGTPDMKLPIQYALFYPDRVFLKGDRLDFGALAGLTFEKPDMKTFRGLALAMEACRAGGSMPTVFNAANERAVQKFLERKIGFTDIYEIIEDCMRGHSVIPSPAVSEILAAEQAVYERIESRWPA